MPASVAQSLSSAHYHVQTGQNHIKHAFDVLECSKCEHASLYGLTFLSILLQQAASGEPLVVQPVLFHLPHEEAQQNLQQNKCLLTTARSLHCTEFVAVGSW